MCTHTRTTRRWYCFERQALVDMASIVPVLYDIVDLALTGSVPFVGPGGPLSRRCALSDGMKALFHTTAGHRW